MLQLLHIIPLFCLFTIVLNETKHGEELSFGRNGTVRVLKYLGEGSFGKVFRAQQISNGEPLGIVALKRLTISKKKDMSHIKLTENEIKLHEMFKTGPHIAKYVGGNRTEDERYVKFDIAIELADGGDMKRLQRSVLKAGKSFGENGVAYYLHKILLALEFIHGLRYVHRDLKPDNILLRETGEPIVSDFGLSGFADDKRKSQRNCGSGLYRAPQVFLARNQSWKEVKEKDTVDKVVGFAERKIKEKLTGQKQAKKVEINTGYGTLGASMSEELIWTETDFGKLYGGYAQDADMFAVGVIACKLLYGEYPFKDMNQLFNNKVVVHYIIVYGYQ
ncbi:protein kinase domain-containing protein [Ditylenchus destructor]|uniref:Protein kinase domain-containing protein n=1 Tax=Ditylenchus destructor TaxID=166010 RepID=A0AAD4R1A3_9BILA|nr:protein kinase domain-containing protein [Ditylenchus destructor]